MERACSSYRHCPSFHAGFPEGFALAQNGLEIASKSEDSKHLNGGMGLNDNENSIDGKDGHIAVDGKSLGGSVCANLSPS